MTAARMAWAAHHEAGHAVATILGWRTARQPKPVPRPAVKFVEITEVEGGRWGGLWFSPQIYTTQWPAHLRINREFREAMEWQIICDLAGPVAEAIHRGRRRGLLHFAFHNCGSDGDFERSNAVLIDLRELTGRQFTEWPFGTRARKLLLAYWPAVTALAEELMQTKRIDGERVEQIFDAAASPTLHALGHNNRKR